jgi:ATP-dependent RNA helicase DHX57
VERVVEDAQSESMALDMIGRRLWGWDDEWGPQAVAVAVPDEERETARLEEKTILSSVLGERYHEASEIEFSIDIDELVLNVIFSPESPYPSEKYPTHPPSFYLTSATLPSYIKLHLHAQVLRAFRDPERPDLRSLLEAGQGGAVYAMLEILEQQLPEAVENPPDVGQVTRFLVPQVEVAEEVEMVPGKRRGQRRKREPMALQGVEERQKRMREMSGWDRMLRTRMALPAWKERDRITALLEKNRVLIVVGEVSNPTSI